MTITFYSSIPNAPFSKLTKKPTSSTKALSRWPSLLPSDIDGAFPTESFKCFCGIYPYHHTKFRKVLCSHTFPTPSHSSPPPFLTSAVTSATSLPPSFPFSRSHPAAHPPTFALLIAISAHPFRALIFDPPNPSLVSALHSSHLLTENQPTFTAYNLQTFNHCSNSMHKSPFPTGKKILSILEKARKESLGLLEANSTGK